MNKIKIKRRENGQLCVYKNGTVTEITVKESFPWVMPGKFLSLRDKKGKEVLFLSDTSGLDNEEIRLLNDEISNIRFVLKIIDIKNIDDEYELRRYDVVTQQGERIFYTKLENWPMKNRDGSIVIQDVSNDLYRICDVSSLPLKAKEKLSYFID